MNNNIKMVKFSEVNFEDVFFKSLKEDYAGFEKWILKKKTDDSSAYILEEESVKGFLYLKEENGEDLEVEPRLSNGRRLKIGTFKVDAHGTKVGERFIKTIFDVAINMGINEMYVTIFEKHENLIELLKQFGFYYYGKKGKESVYLKKLDNITRNIYLDYPLIDKNNNKKYLLAILPEYHTHMFSDSRLNTEKDIDIKNISYTNSIRKIYMCKMEKVKQFKKGDLVVIYRMKERNKIAKYNSVATSIAVVDEMKKIEEFANFESYFEYCNKYSIFTKDEITKNWYNRKYPFIIRMLYNVALNKRITRDDLLNKVGMDGSEYFGALELTDEQFEKILNFGGVNENYFIS